MDELLLELPELDDCEPLPDAGVLGLDEPDEEVEGVSAGWAPEVCDCGADIMEVLPPPPQAVAYNRANIIAEISAVRGSVET